MPWAMSYWLESGAYWGNKLPPDAKRDIMDRLPGSEPDNPEANYWRKPSNPSDPGPWTIQNYWIYPNEPKVFGAFSARRVQMWPENLVNYPPFGNVKLQTPHVRSHTIGTIKVHMKPETIYVSLHTPLWKAKQKLNRGEPIEIDEEDLTWMRRQYAQMRPILVAPTDNPWGPRVRRVAPGWLQHSRVPSAEELREFISDDMRQVKAQLQKAQYERWAEKRPQHAKKQPSRDLFS